MNLGRLAVTTGSGLLLPLIIITVPWYPARLMAGFLLAAFLPGYTLLITLWPQPNSSPVNSPGKWLVAVAASYSISVVLLLVLLFTAIPFNNLSVAGSLGLTILVFSAIAWRRRPTNPEAPEAVAGSSSTSDNTRRQFIWLLVILVIAAIFRMVSVHYSDHQGDEADILLRAVSLTYGHTEAIFTHSKGPGEILLLNAAGALTGRFDEQTARLLFSLAGVVSIGLIMLLGEQLAGPIAGRVGGVLAAIDGVFISYARTAQYQSVVLLLTLATIWSYYRFQQTGGRSRRWHALGTFLLAAACLFHFETILLFPVLGYLTVRDIPWRGFKTVPTYLLRLRYLGWSVLIFVTTVTLFYLPFLLHPHLIRTGNYLENRVSGGSFPPFNNLQHFFYFEGLKYNSIYYVALFNLFLLLAVLVSLARALNQTVIRVTSYVIIISMIGVGLALAGLSKPSGLVFAVGMAMFFILVILSPRIPAPHRTLWLWVAPPFWVYVFLVNRPGKHHYLFLGALMILVGWVVTETWRWAAGRWPELRQPIGKWLAAGASVILLLIIAGHSVMLFLRSDLEYMLTYPAHKSSFYPTGPSFPYGTRIGFGYPFRLGWQVIGQLKRTGQLAGEWAGNDDGNAPSWYMLGTPPTPCYPRYVLRGETTYKGDEDFDVPFNPTDFGYVPRYRIWGNDRLRMTVLEFDPLADEPKPVDLYETDRFDPPVTAGDFASALTRSESDNPSPQTLLDPALVLGEGSEIKNNAPAAYLERAQQLDGRVALVGYDLDDRYARPGGIVPITLYWQLLTPLSLRNKVFIHLISAEGQLLTQADDFPVCGTSHANSWLPGQTVADRHLLKLPAELPPGTYPLVVGMYEPDLKLRLNYFDSAGNEQGNSLTIGSLIVGAE